MIRYTISPNQPHRHYIDIIVNIESRGAERLEVQLPAWRPGRYELGNFAQNIQHWEVFDAEGNALHSYKISKDKWVIETRGAAEVVVTYNFYANLMTAGDSYFDEKQLYINPVNCLIYMQERILEPCQISLQNLPASYGIACSLDFDSNRTAIAQDYHILADSPFIASPDLVHRSFDTGGARFNIWMLGNAAPGWERLIADFEAFSNAQIAIFGELPVSEYHFLYQMVNTKFYHGVEHLASNVICIGPGYNLMCEEDYTSFLGISSHELFHSWNVKSIRPAGMFPYDYSRENYTTLNYVTEGVTSYYGDFALLRANVYSWETYALRTAKTLERHQHNFGRLYQSLDEASIDAWIDGYKTGAPSRKISFYQKGALVAWILDLCLMRDSGNKYSLDSVMKALYHDFAKAHRGYTEADYLGIISQMAGKNYGPFFEKYISGLEDIIPILQDVLDYIGCTLETQPGLFYHEQKLGLKVEEPAITNKTIITQIAPGSPADQARLSPNDEIIAVNGISIDRFPDELFRFFAGSPMELQIIRNKEEMATVVSEGDAEYYPRYVIAKNLSASPAQQQNFMNWSGMQF